MDREHGAFPRIAAEADRSTLRLEDEARDRQPEPRSDLLGGEVEVEDLVADLEGDPGAGVLEVHADHIPFPAGADRQRAPPAHRLDRVERDVEEGLREAY